MGIPCAFADTPSLRNQVYQLRQECCLRTGAIEPRADGCFVDPYDSDPNHFSFAGQARCDVLMRLTGNMAALADFHEVDWFMASPRVEHADMYPLLFGFEELAQPRKYFGVAFETALPGTRLVEYTGAEKAMRKAHEEALAHVIGLLKGFGSALAL